jgi:hypothetical protein
MRTFIVIAALAALISGAQAAGSRGGGHGGGAHMGGGFHGAMHGGGVHEDFHGGGVHRGGFARPGGIWYDGVWCPWPAYYAGECSYD